MSERRGRRAYSIGAVLCSLAVVVPVVWGTAPLPRELPFADNVAWLASDSEGELVRVNVETGRVDARLPVDGLSGTIHVAQGYGSVSVQVSDRLVGLDLANLTWGEPISAEGDAYAADGRVYVLDRQGTVLSLAPKDLEERGRLELGETATRPVVAGERLVVPTADGTVHVVEDDTVVGRFRAGGEQEWLGLSRIGEQVAVLNATRGAVATFDPTARNPELRDWAELSEQLPEGGVQMAGELPEGPLWVASPESGELVRVDPDDGSTEVVEVTPSGNRMVGPAVTGDRAYVVDVDAAELVQVDASALAVTHRHPIEVTDPDAVELMAVSEWVVVNDRAGSQAAVVGRDGEPITIDKYDADGVAVAIDTDLVNDTGPPDRPAPEDGAGDQRPPAGDRDERPDPRSDRDVPTTTTGPPPTDPQREPPGAVGALSASSGDGRANLSWSAPSGRTDDYEVTVDPAVGGQSTFSTTATSYSFSSLTNGAPYTFTVAARNEGGAGPTESTRATPGRAPTASSVSAERTGDREFRVTFSYDAGGRAVDTCRVVVGSSTHNATCSGGTGTATGISVADFATSYTFRAEIATALGSNSATGTGTSANKPLTVAGVSDPDRFDGTCTWSWDGTPNARPYYNGAAHGCPNRAGEPQPAGYISSGTAVRATCRTSGDRVTDDYENASSTWVRIEGHGYMNTLWFTSWNSNPEAGLPPC
jgi:hypothetical protein